MTPPVLADAEVVGLLRESPDLLAVADAIGATQSVPRVRSNVLRLLAVAAVVAVAGALALAAPWDGRSGGFVERALAALGDGQVIHVVSVSEVPNAAVIDLGTGAETPVVSERELWFDESRGLERAVYRTGGVVVTDELQTPEGAWTQGGPVYTCAWIAAHPIEATKARVSCNASGENGTVPRAVPEPRPRLEPTLAGFVGGYREALATGAARLDGEGVLDGRAVKWLRFEESAGEEPVGKAERVAVDVETLKPVLIETYLDGRLARRSRISLVETLDPGGVNFSRPTPLPPGSELGMTRRTGEQVVSAAAASAALDGRLLTAGRTLGGLPLDSIELAQISTGHGPRSGTPPTRSQGVEVGYGSASYHSRSGGDYVVLKESLRAEALYWFVGPNRVPPAEGSMRVLWSGVVAAPRGGGRAVPTGERVWRGQLRLNGVYVTIEASSKPLLLDAARSLTTEGTR